MDGPALLLGPLLRHVERTRATVWVETDRPCRVTVTVGDVVASTSTTCVDGCSYALVVVEGLTPDRVEPYAVALDDVRVWPEPGSDLPPSVVVTAGGDRPLRVALGSCRASAPHTRRWQRRVALSGVGRGVDALRAMAADLAQADVDGTPGQLSRPDLLLLLGDQVYADENLPPAVAGRIAGKRDVTRGPGRQVSDLEEYRWLYRESWSEPLVRWLLSTVPSAMIFDDHELIDDWNTSASWLADHRADPWWDTRSRAAMASYWLYQHWGNLTPAELARDELAQAMAAAAGTGEDVGPRLLDFAARADVEAGDDETPVESSARWSYARDLADDVRLLVVDSRAGRVLGEERRRMLDAVEQRWVLERATGDRTHLLIASSLPVLVPEGVHHLEAVDEVVAGGAWGPRWAWRAEQLRRRAGLSHWAAFGDSFELLTEHLSAVARGERGAAPASVVLLSGDVHNGYLAAASARHGPPLRSAVWQVVCSPLRNPLHLPVRLGYRLLALRAVRTTLRGLARASGLAEPAWRWEVEAGPWFGNQVMTLELDGNQAHVVARTAHRTAEGRGRLRERGRVRLTGGTGPAEG